MSGHFGAVEADFQSHYGLDLREVLWGEHPVGVRRVLSLVSGLPIQGAVFRATVTNGKHWTPNEELLATLIEVTDFTNRLLHQANFKGKAWKPITIERPSAAPEKMRPATPEEIHAFFSGSELGELVVDN